MPPRKPRTNTTLRDELRATLADGLAIAERYEGLGMAGAGEQDRRRLQQLDNGNAVTVAGWELADALGNLGTDTRTLRSVLEGADHYAVGPDGTYNPARV